VGLLDEFLNCIEIVHEANEHDIVVGRRRDDEEFLLLRSKMLIDIFRIFKWDEAILFPMDDQGG